MLVLALRLHFYNDRFDLGCKVYSFIGMMLIEPLMSILGIDHYGKVKRIDRNWSEARVFFDGKVQELKKLSKNVVEGTTLDKVVSRCAKKVVENVERQLSAVAYF